MEGPLRGGGRCLRGAGRPRGILLLTGDATGMDFVFAGMVGAIIAAVINAWILLVEILR